MKKFLVGILALVLVCTTLSNASFASAADCEDNYGVSVASDWEPPDYSHPIKKP